INQEYTLGQTFKEEYGEFLGEYKSDKIVVHTGEDNRTIVSGQAMLAGLFPPKVRVIADLPWQPIPIHSRGNLDEVSFGIIGECEGLEKKVKENPRYQGMMDKIDPSLLEILRNKTGLPIEDPYQYQNVLDSLKTKYSLNSTALPFPQWALPLAPALNNYSTEIHTQMTHLLNESSGGFHADILLSSIEQQLLLPTRKAFFISGHDTNLFVLGQFFRAKVLTADLCKVSERIENR
ncbi:acp-5, partial [Pristionchus pacificus]